MSIVERLSALDWNRLTAQIDRHGWATTGPMLTADECRNLSENYDEESLYRSRVIMARHGFGQGHRISCG